MLLVCSRIPPSLIDAAMADHEPIASSASVATAAGSGSAQSQVRQKGTLKLECLNLFAECFVLRIWLHVLVDTSRARAHKGGGSGRFARGQRSGREILVLMEREREGGRDGWLETKGGVASERRASICCSACC